LSFAPSQGDLPFTADAGQLRQALVNLIKNGLEAVDGAGRVSVAATLAGGMLEISVADDGPGLDDEKKSRLFAPGFTTKPGGSGLGLTIVERIVNEHGGTIAVESRPGAGTTFRVRLPLQPDAGGAHAPGETPRT
jgi:signal transduction histidine kinase